LAGGKIRRSGELEARFQVLTRAEFHILRGLDFDLFSRLRIDPYPGFSLDNLECAEANELDGFTSFKTDFDPFDYCIDRSLGECLADLFAKSFLHALDQVCFVHLVVGFV
jgi:hypothetical protein